MGNIAFTFIFGNKSKWKKLHFFHFGPKLHFFSFWPNLHFFYFDIAPRSSTIHSTNLEVPVSKLTDVQPQLVSNIINAFPNNVLPNQSYQTSLLCNHPYMIRLQHQKKLMKSEIFAAHETVDELPKLPMSIYFL